MKKIIKLHLKNLDKELFVLDSSTWTVCKQIGSVSLFNGISTFVGYLMLKLFS